MTNTKTLKLNTKRGRFAPPSTLGSSLAAVSAVCTTRRMKAALIRRNDLPAGQPGNMFLRCECGAEVDVPNAFTDERVACTCGVEYDSRGWIQ